MRASAIASLLCGLAAATHLERLFAFIALWRAAGLTGRAYKALASSYYVGAHGVTLGTHLIRP